MRPSWIGHRLAEHVAAADLPPVRLHDLRHVAATLMLAAGVEMKVVQEILGHSSYSVTMNLYTSVLPQLSKGAAKATVDLVPRRRRFGHPSAPQEINTGNASANGGSP